jgi:hypothetical protein
MWPNFPHLQHCRTTATKVETSIFILQNYTWGGNSLVLNIKHTALNSFHTHLSPLVSSFVSLTLKSDCINDLEWYGVFIVIIQIKLLHQTNSKSSDTSLMTPFLITI